MNQRTTHTEPPPNSKAAAYGYGAYASSTNKAMYVKSSKTDYTFPIAIGIGARYYDSDLSVWLSVDPMADKYPSLSPYAYVANNPVILVDPDGNKIVVTRVVNNNGKDNVKISFTAELVNISSKEITMKQMNSIKNNISNQIKESFGGEYDDFDVSVDVSITVRESYNDVTGDDGHIISIVNPDDEVFDSPNDAGGTERNSSDNGNIYLSSRIVDDKDQLKRTGAHEFGHAAGLKHPNDKNASTIDKNAGLNNKNLMHQSSVSNGTEIEAGQIEKMDINN